MVSRYCSNLSIWIWITYVSGDVFPLFGLHKTCYWYKSRYIKFTWWWCYIIYATVFSMKWINRRLVLLISHSEMFLHLISSSLNSETSQRNNEVIESTGWNGMGSTLGWKLHLTLISVLNAPFWRCIEARLWARRTAQVPPRMTLVLVTVIQTGLVGFEHTVFYHILSEIADTWTEKIACIIEIESAIRKRNN